MLFEKLLLTRILSEVGGCGLDSYPNTARLVERVSRNVNEKKITGTLFLDVTKAFDTVWVAS
jgi:hypothetical protein